MVNLISSPDEYSGKLVRVKGYLSADSGLQLYLSEDHAKIWDHASSISVSDPTHDAYMTLNCQGAYGTVDATLQRISDAPMLATSAFFFILADVERILLYDEAGKLEQC